MNMLTGKKLVCGMAAIVALGSSSAFAGAWTSPAGNAASFSYSNGQDINGLFGDPSVFGDGLFFQTSFLANASNGATQSLTDTVSFDVVSNPGLSFSSLSVQAFGSYSVTGDATNSVDVDALLSMDENTGLLRNFSGALVTDVAFPVQGEASGLFSGEATVNFEFIFPTPSNDIHIALQNNVLAITTAGGTAEVNLNFQNLTLDFGIIPEPASLSLLAFGSLGLIRRRR